MERAARPAREAVNAIRITFLAEAAISVWTGGLSVLWTAAAYFTGYVWTGFAALAMGLMIVAAALVTLRRRLRDQTDGWTLIAAIAQLALVVVGGAALPYVPTVSGAGTNGPFADGADASLALTAWIFFAGGVLGAVLLALELLHHRSTTSARRR